MVDVLERNGHVVRQASDHDARVKTIAMTDAARQVCFSDEFCAAGDELVEKMFAGFSAKERQDFLRLLGRVQDNLQRIGD